MAYRIACHPEPKQVTGYAIELPPPFDAMRFCVRRCGAGDWTIDHYDTGYAFCGPLIHVLDESKANRAALNKWRFEGGTQVKAVAWLCRYLDHLRRTKRGKALLRKLRSLDNSADK